MEFGQLKPEHKKLASLAGKWSGPEKIHPTPWDPKGGAATGRADARVALDGFVVITDYEQERDGKVTYRGHGVFGWDPFESCYVMSWADTMGGAMLHAARGEWVGNTLTFSASNPMGHSRYIYTFQSDTQHAFRIEMSQDGKNWAPFLEATYTRK